MKVQINGSEVFYGTGSGTPKDTAQTLVFVHGAGFDHTIWVMPARYFARHGWRVVAVDLPGHGRSQGLPLTSIKPTISIRMQPGAKTLAFRRRVPRHGRMTMPTGN